MADLDYWPIAHRLRSRAKTGVSVPVVKVIPKKRPRSKPKKLEPKKVQLLDPISEDEFFTPAPVRKQISPFNVTPGPVLKSFSPFNVTPGPVRNSVSPFKGLNIHQSVELRHGKLFPWTQRRGLATELFEPIPGHKSIGTVKRLQQSIEEILRITQAEAEKMEEDEMEFSMDDLDKGLSWTRKWNGFSTKIKEEVEGAVKNKAPDETFFEVEHEIDLRESFEQEPKQEQPLWISKSKKEKMRLAASVADGRYSGFQTFHASVMTSKPPETAPKIMLFPPTCKCQLQSIYEGNSWSSLKFP